jgi:hypothetical protein
MRVLVDLDSGTIINGPVIVVDVEERLLQDMENNDSVARYEAQRYEIARLSI